MKVKEIGVSVVKSHKGSFQECQNVDTCLEKHVLILDVSLTFENGKKWVKDKEYVKNMGEFETYEAAHKEMMWVHDQLQAYLEEEKPKYPNCKNCNFPFHPSTAILDFGGSVDFCSSYCDKSFQQRKK